MRIKLTLFAFAIIFSLSSLQASGSEPHFTYQVKCLNDWVFYAPSQPFIAVTVQNNRLQTTSATLCLKITTDMYVDIASLSQTMSLGNADSTRIDFSFTLPQPGFYRCTLSGQKNDGEVHIIKKFNIGYEPESIVSLPDNQPDLKTFWDVAKAELATVTPDYQLTLIPDSSNTARKLYLVKMKSLGGVEISDQSVKSVGNVPILHYLCFDD